MYARFGILHLQGRRACPLHRIQPRLIGVGPATVWVDDVSLRAAGTVGGLRPPDLPAEFALANDRVVVRFHTGDATLTVVDRRRGTTWEQQAMSQGLVVTNARAAGGELRVGLLQVATGAGLGLTVRLDPERPEFTVTADGSADVALPLRFPHPFVSGPDTRLIIPLNEGISYPVTDEAVAPTRLIAYGGHGICMGFWGVVAGEAGLMTIIETPDDAAIRLDRHAGRLFVAPEWDARKGAFGYPRRLRYVCLARGGYVGMCKRYRVCAQEAGRLKTLRQKARANPNVDLLIGAANIWYFAPDGLAMAQEMQALGMQRLLWSNRASPDTLRALNAMKVLTSRYDIYQDVMDPANFKYLRGVHPDWTTAGWPKDLMRGPRGDWLRGWEVRGTNGQWYACGVLCDRVAPAYAARRIPDELATHLYRCRFIDTTTASPWRECYDPAHPLTRAESRHWKTELLRYVADDLKLVTGSETGHEAAAPYVDYFEGMLSLGPYRVPDAGRDMQRLWTEVPDAVRRFQLGQAYRLPLWELVYHDCVVAHWYWGDYNNKLPSLWDKRDLFNVLYGTPPMFMFTRALWEQNKDRFVRSYTQVCRVARAVGYAEMVDHRILTADRDVQQTRFANGVEVTVNFGDRAYRLPSGVVVPPVGFVTAGMPAAP